MCVDKQTVAALCSRRGGVMDLATLGLITYVVWVFWLSKCFTIASLIMLIYDYLLTLDLEVKLIWKADWNLGKFLFLLTRYLPFFDTAVVLYYQFSPVHTSRQCEIAYQYSAWMFVVGMTIAELLLTIRTWAVWEKDIRLGVALSILYAGFLVAEYVAVGLYLKSLTHEVSPLQPLVTCFVSNMNRLLSICWIVLMAYDAVIFTLIAIQAIRTFRLWGNVPLLRVIYQDGIIYFAYLFGLSFLNAIIILKLPLEYVNLLSLMERIAHALLTCRIILHIRELDARNTRPREIEEIALMDLTA